MTTNLWPLVELTARSLDQDERDAVLGDSLEVGDSALKTFFGVLGLVVRRQLRLWRGWRPWIAAFGFALPCSLLLAYVSVSVTCTSERLMGIRISHWAPTGHEGVLMLLCHIFLLITWAWTSGFTVGSVSPRTLWLNVIVSLWVVVYFGMHVHVATFPHFYSLLFVAPALWGIRRGMHIAHLGLRTALLLAATMTVLTATAWMDNALWIFNWLLLCPAWYLVVTARVGTNSPIRDLPLASPSSK